MLHHEAAKKLVKLLYVLIVAVVLAAVASGGAEAARKRGAKSPPVDRYASIVIEAATGFVVSEKNADKRLYPASLTKMMTLYMTFEALDSGVLRKNQRLSVSKKASLQEPSKLNLKPGSTISVEDAILALVTKSANDVAVVLAEAIGGSESRFGRLMTAKAKTLGMNGSNFVNASGLHNPSQYSTARDMATLGQALIRDFPRHYRYFSTANFSYAGQSHKNHNKLMASYKGMDGIKTGYIHASGYNLVASAARDGTRLIGVVFGGKTSLSRNAHMATLLDAGFSKVNDVRIASLIDARKTQGGGASVPLRKPVSQLASAVQASPEVYARSASQQAGGGSSSPRFDAMGLVIDQGDADEPAAETLTANRVVRNGPVPSFPETSRTKLAVEAPSIEPASGGGWAVQVGAFSTYDAGVAALKAARSRISPSLSSGGQQMIVPLMTNRGVIYRARLGGLDRAAATGICRTLQGNCLVLAAQ